MALESFPRHSTMKQCRFLTIELDLLGSDIIEKSRQMPLDMAPTYLERDAIESQSLGQH